MFSKARKLFLCHLYVAHFICCSCNAWFPLPPTAVEENKGSPPLVSVVRAACIVILPQKGRDLSDTPISTQEAIKQGGKLVFMVNMASTVSSTSNMRKVNLYLLRLSAFLNDSSLWIFHWDDVQHWLF